MALISAYILPHPPVSIPEIGKGSEQEITDTLSAFQEVGRRMAHHKPETIIIISPHSAYYGNWIYVASGDVAEGNMMRFDAPEVSFSLNYDDEFRDCLLKIVAEYSIPAGYVGEFPDPLDHGMMVPLYFINQHLSSDSYKAVSIGGSGLPRDILLRFGCSLARAAEECAERVVLIASGDLSHKLKPQGPYGYDAAGPEFDSMICDIVRSGDPSAFMRIEPELSEEASDCGLSGFIMMAGALEETKRIKGVTFESELLSYEGPFGVGYAVAAYEGKVLQQANS